MLKLQAEFTDMLVFLTEVTEPPAGCPYWFVMSWAYEHRSKVFIHSLYQYKGEIVKTVKIRPFYWYKIILLPGNVDSCQRAKRALPPSSLICKRPKRILLLDGQHLGTCPLNTCHRSVRILILSMWFSILTTSYHTNCTCLWGLLQ